VTAQHAANSSDSGEQSLEVPADPRAARITAGLALDRSGIEISPLFRAVVAKSAGDVFYVDRCSAEESRRKHAGHAHADQILDVDVVWEDGRRLAECVPAGRRFSWAVASHVLEHVPDPVGWLHEVLEVLDDGGVISLALPDKRHCFDLFRADTTAAELVEAWIRQERIPTPRQLFDFLRNAVADGYVGHQGRTSHAVSPAECGRSYQPAEALSFVRLAWTTGIYLDAHCSVFSPETFVALITELRDLGLLPVEVSTPEPAGSEFFVRLTKRSEPLPVHPGRPHPGAIGIAPAPADEPVAGVVPSPEPPIGATDERGPRRWWRR
jgi:SAM-dependent methyltransferase